MKVAITRIGNSKGIRLNKKLLEKYQIGDEVELLLEESSIRIKPIIRARANWDEAFSKMRKRGDDQLLIDGVLTCKDWD